MVKGRSDPYKHVLDEVSLTYNGASRIYDVSFHKIVRNVSSEPLQYVYARIAVSLFPDEPKLARQYHRNNPLSLEAIQFAARNVDGTPLYHEIAQFQESNVELLLWFQDEHSRRPFPIAVGQMGEIFYSIHISDALWGPFLLRHVRVPCDQLAVTLTFPAPLVDLWAEMRRSGSWQSIEPPTVSKRSGVLASYHWSRANPAIQSRFRFRWSFKDHREAVRREEFEKLQAVESKPPLRQDSPASGEADEAIRQGQATVSPDFRSLYWFGNHYTFTPLQAACIRELWEAWRAGTPGVGHRHLIEAAKGGAAAGGRVPDIFRDSPAWKIVVCTPKKGVYCLTPPQHEGKPTEGKTRKLRRSHDVRQRSSR